MTVARPVCPAAGHFASRKAVENDCRVQDGPCIIHLAKILVQRSHAMEYVPVVAAVGVAVSVLFAFSVVVSAGAAVAFA